MKKPLYLWANFDSKAF